MARLIEASGLCVAMWLVVVGGAVLGAGIPPEAHVAGGAAAGVAHPGSLGVGLEDPVAALASRPLAALRRLHQAAGDRSSGQPIEMGGDRVLRFIYCDTFAEPWFAEDAAIEGVSCLSWDGSAPALHFEGRGPERRRVSLTYHFTAPYDAKELVTHVQGVIHGGTGDRVELTMSANGRDFIHPARAWGRAAGNEFHLMSAAGYQFDRQSFWIRVAADLAPGARVTLQEFTANCRVKPPGRPEVALAPDSEGRLRYSDTMASSRLLHLAEVENAQALQWRRGGALLCGQQGNPTRVVIRQKFVAACPLRSVVVRVRHAVGPRTGGSNSFGLSLDGATLVARSSAPGADGALAGDAELRLDDPAALAGAQQFFLHITLDSGAGGPGTATNVLSGIEVEVRSADQPIRTAAAPGGTPPRP